MGRPVGADWRPLGLDSDPVPGNPGRISEEAQHLAAVANQITEQVARLRAIASAGEEVGQHAEKIRSTASQLAGTLGKVVGRYQKVSSALTGWIPELEQAQAMSIQALNQAEAPYRQLNTPALLPSGDHLTAQQKQAIQDYHTAMRRAQGELDAARALLAKATQLRDTQGSYYAGLINKASDDGMKDSFWDSFSDFFSSLASDISSFVSEHAGIIKDICTVLEVVATVLAIVALFVPGLNLIVILGLAFTAIALAGRTALWATGNGSGVDVALDVLGLVTFGFGKVIGAGLRSTFASARGLATEARAAEIAASPAGRIATRIAGLAERAPGSSLVNGVAAGLHDIGLARAGEGLTSMVAKVSEFVGAKSETVLEHIAGPAVDKTLATVSKDVRPVEIALNGGEKEFVLLTRKMAALTGQFGGNPQFDQLAAQFGRELNLARGSFGINAAAQLGNYAVRGIDWYGTDNQKVFSFSPAGEAWHLVSSAWR